MSSKFQTRTRGGFHWLTALVNGRVHWLHRQARLGDLMRPGQRYLPPPGEESEEDAQKHSTVSAGRLQ